MTVQAGRFPGGYGSKKVIGALVGIAVCAMGPVAAEGVPRWVAEGPFVEAASFRFELPVERLATKLYVQVEIGGKSRRFVFDTGSPSMIRKELAEELGLAVIDSRRGTDSHGTVIESEVVQADLGLGGVTVRKVPLFAADFAASPAAACLVGDGVLGSEVLPLCAWQIDLPDGVVRCHTAVEELEHVGVGSRQRLYDFGYPHLPFLDVRLADEAHSKAMFDTGSPELFTISPPDLEGTRKAAGVGRTIAGRGSLGGSLGGQAPVGVQTRSELASLAVGTLPLGSVWTTRREAPPSLVGAHILEHFVVTLDARSGAAFFDAYRAGPYGRPSFGFALAFDGEISVGLVWEGSPAAAAGLVPGTRLTAINGAPTAWTCAGIREALEAMSGDAVELAWEGGAATVVRCQEGETQAGPARKHAADASDRRF